MDRNKVKEDDHAEAAASYTESWETLPTDLLVEILRRVEAAEYTLFWDTLFRNYNRNGVVACAGVCRRWREVTKEMMAGRSSFPRNFTFPSSLKQPGPHDTLHQCLVTRDKKTSTFYLDLDPISTFPAIRSTRKFLIAAKRYRHSAHTEYIMSIDPNDISQGSNTYVGKIRSDFMGTSFTIYDSQPTLNGERHSNNESSRCVASKQISPQVRAGNFEVGLVSYLKPKGVRRMVCAVNYVWPEKHTRQQLKENFQGRKDETISNSCTVLSSKTPRWDEESQCWRFSLHGRVGVPSVKTFQLVKRQPGGKEDEEMFVLQFYKLFDNTYSLTYRQPLSAFEAFAICLTSFGR